MVEVAQTPTPCRFAAVPLGKGDKVLVENGIFIVPLTKGDSREAAGGQGLSHFYYGLQECTHAVLPAFYRIRSGTRRKAVQCFGL